jgi:glyoxylase-like metal-dependent hydrolase (beta-lactamase superfamily II)
VADGLASGLVDPAEVAAAKPKRLPPWAGPTPWGGEGYQPGLRRRIGFRFVRAMSHFFGTIEPSRRVDDATVLRLGGRDWVAVHTPGHTPDHLCLLDPAEGILLSGDHVLPTITPHISGISTTEDPLADFFSSLERMADLPGVQRVLPAHGDPFDDLAGRVKSIERHHEERLDTLRVASLEMGPATVQELSKKLFKPRAWGPMAESETYAHLEHLRVAGQATRREVDGGLVYDVRAVPAL